VLQASDVARSGLAHEPNSTEVRLCILQHDALLDTCHAGV
jgi:hypothetical protein